MAPAAARHRGSRPGWVLAAGLGSGVLTWLSLTTGHLLSVGQAVALTLVVVVAATLVARRSPGRGRRLALVGALVAALPLVVVAVLLSVSDG